MTTSTLSVESEPQDKPRSTAREESLQHVEVTLFWRGEAPWVSCPSQEAFEFHCLGVRFGSGRWQLHLAQIDRRLPGMSKGQRRELISALRQVLASTTGLAIQAFSNDLILEPA